MIISQLPWACNACCDRLSRFSYEKFNDLVVWHRSIIFWLRKTALEQGHRLCTIPRFPRATQVDDILFLGLFAATDLIELSAETTENIQMKYDMFHFMVEAAKNNGIATLVT